MKVLDRELGEHTPPYIIAELSANHGGSLEQAKRSISAAAKSGVAAVKIQSYTPDTMTLNCDKADFVVKEGLWAGRTLFDLYAEAYTPFEWHAELFRHAAAEEITLFSTPFDESAVDLLESLHVPAYKIASFEVVDLPLIRYVASKNKPIFLSTGTASQSEVVEAVATIREHSDSDLLLFHTVSSYPARTRDANLRNITWLRDTFGAEVGLSDHTTSNVAALTAIGLGAVAIEKHFKLDGSDTGPDSSFSLTVEQLRHLVHDCEDAWAAKGVSGFNRAVSEEENLIFRRSLYFVRDLKRGEPISEGDVRRVRPGFGLPPKMIDWVVGRKVTVDVEVGDAVTYDKVGEP